MTKNLKRGTINNHVIVSIINNKAFLKLQITAIVLYKRF